MAEREKCLETSDDFVFDFGDFQVEVRCSVEQMRRDYAIGLERLGIDPDTIACISQALDVDPEYESQGGARMAALASAERRLSVPLENSELWVNLYLDILQRNMGRRINRANLRKKSEPVRKEMLTLTVKQVLESVWRHEREHLFQATWQREEWDEESDYEKKALRRTFLISNVSRVVMFAASFLRSGIPARNNYDLGNFLGDSLRALSLAYLSGEIATAMSRLYNYYKSPAERPAFSAGKAGKNLDGIFEVTIVER